MGYCILWLSSVTVAVLIAGLGAVAGARLRKRWQTIAATAASALPGLFLGLSTTILTGRLLARGVEHHWFGCSLSWLLVFAAASVLLGLRAFTSESGDGEPRARSWPLGGIATGIGVCVAVFLVTLFCMDIVARTELARMHAEALARLHSAAPARVPDSRNAALVYSQAFEQMGDTLPWRKMTWHRDMERPTLDATTEEVEALLRGQSETHALIRRASAMPDFFFEANHARGLAARIPRLLNWDGGARLLTMSAFNRAARGDARGALEDISAARRMAAHLASGTVLLQISIGITVNRDACLAYEHLLHCCQFEPGTLGGHPVETSSDQYRAAYQRALEFEAASYTLFLTGGGRLKLLYPVGRDEEPRQRIETWLADRMPVLWRVFFLRDEIATFDSMLDRYRALYYFSYGEMLEKEKKLSSEYWEMRSRALLTSIGLLQIPIFTQSQLAENRLCQAFADLALATRGYRGDKGRYPATLAELVPAYIDAVPVDPYSPGGERIKMSLVGDGVVLYSVGPDGKDDGGVSNNAWRPLQGTEGDHNFCLGAAYEERRLKPIREAEERRAARKAKLK